MGFTAVVDGLAAFRRLDAFVSQSCRALFQKQRWGGGSRTVRVPRAVTCCVHQGSFDLYQEDLRDAEAAKVQTAEAPEAAEAAEVCEAEIEGSFAHGSEKNFELTADLTLRPGGGPDSASCNDEHIGV